MVGRSFGNPPKKLMRPCRAAIWTACSWAAPEAAAVMTTSGPRPSVSLTTASTTSVSPPHTAASGWTSPAARSSRSRLRSMRKTRAAPRARASRTCRQPIGPAPMTATSSAAPALGALSTGDRRDHLYPVARPPVAHPGTGLDHLSGDLVAHDPRRHDVVVTEPVDLHVGAARRAVPHPDQHLTGAG